MRDLILITLAWLASVVYYEVIRPLLKYGYKWKCPEKGCGFVLEANIYLPYFKIIEVQHIKSHTDRNFKE